MQKKLIWIAIAVFILACACNNQTDIQVDSPSKVEIVKTDDKYRLTVNGLPFYVKGAGLEFGNIEALGSHGANSFRTWRTYNGKDNSIKILDKAQQNGLMVLMGLEVGRERHGYDYNDTVWVKQQFQEIKKEVIRLKDHPALLAWAIGNELNLRAENLRIYNAVNDISKMIHQVDPNHPTTTTLSGISKHEIDYIKMHCTDIDFLSVQFYGDIVNLKKRIDDAGWTGPYMVTEWGATGHWESPVTSWGSWIEPSSNDKAKAFIERYKIAIEADQKKCLGSYVFLWGQKQERTPTWYGMFLETGEETETVDAMHYIWNGKWPGNLCPELKSFTLNEKQANDNIIIKKDQTLYVNVSANDLDNDTLLYKWEILPETTDLSTGGDFESRPETVLLLESDSPVDTLKAPNLPGAYRVFVYVLDQKGHAATANIPFYVEK